MKAVIEKLIYDTEKSELIGKDSYSNPRDFNYWSESLYKTPGGRYFLAGEGGARSKYAVQLAQNSVGGGEKIVPMTREEAIAWCESHERTETLLSEFGDALTEA